MAQAALDAGHDVTLLHRNATDELPGATHLLADRNGDLSVLDEQTWDATIDVCAYVPGQVRRLHEALGDRGGHHVFISTVSVYQEPDGPAPTRTHRSSQPAAEDVDRGHQRDLRPAQGHLREHRHRRRTATPVWRSSDRRTSWARAT